MSSPQPISRRRALQQAACGFGGLALAGLAGVRAGTTNPLAMRLPPGRPRAKRILFLFMQGGPSQVDTYDHKPALARHDGQRLGFDDARTLANTGTRGTDLLIGGTSPAIGYGLGVSYLVYGGGL